MNSNNKTLLVTTAVAVRLLSIAQGLRDTEVQDGSARTIGMDTEFDGYTIEHTHAEYGPQRLLVDQIHKDLYSVSFAGHEKFLEQIGTTGWESSAEALAAYLVELNPELELSLEEFRCEAIGDDFVVYSLADEAALNLEDPELAQLFFGQLISQAAREVEAILDVVDAPAAAEEVLRTTEDAVQQDVIDATLDAGSQAADHPDDVDTPQAASFRQKALKFIGSPMGVAACVAVLAMVGVGAKCIASHLTNGVSDELIA